MERVGLNPRRRAGVPDLSLVALPTRPPLRFSNFRWLRAVCRRQPYVGAGQLTQI